MKSSPLLGGWKMVVQQDASLAPLSVVNSVVFATDSDVETRSVVASWVAASELGFSVTTYKLGRFSRACLFLLRV